jgi:hypothetical protein
MKSGKKKQKGLITSKKGNKISLLSGNRKKRKQPKDWM